MQNTSVHFIAAGLLILWFIGCGREESGTFPGGATEDNEVSLIGAWLSEEIAYTDTRYIRPPGQVYGSGNGSSWDNAHSGIPAQLERGTQYWLASGDYYIEDPVADDPVYEFDDDDTGAAFIGIVKATSAEHGEDAGWLPTMGDGPAILGPTAFVTGHYIIDLSHPAPLAPFPIPLSWGRRRAISAGFL